jgi:hypothetical protein
VERVFLHPQDAHSLQHRVKRIGDIADFESRASQLIATLDPSLAILSLRAAIASLHSQCVETGKAETERDTLEAQNNELTPPTLTGLCMMTGAGIRGDSNT